MSARFAPLPDAVTSEPDRAEREVLERWRSQDVFRAVQSARAGAPAFVFWEGPPTANGRPGIHHVIARTVKDTVCRYRTMRGRRVVRKAGWDTQGLPVELEVEKALGISGKPQIEAYGVAAFNAKCRESVWTYRQEWEELSERIGFWLDYADPYVTYEKEYIDSVWFLLAAFHRAGLVYRGKRVLPYCGRCGTSLSAHEMAQPGVYQDVVDPSVTLRFRALESAHPEGESFLAWTTTPWTLPSNFALCVHPEHEYVLARAAAPAQKGAAAGASELVWVAAARADQVLAPGWQELERKPGRALAGRAYQRLFEAEPARLEPGQWEADESLRHRVYAADFVTVEDGTGIVHQAPYGVDDWETARAEHLPLPAAVRGEGRFAEAFGPVAAGTFFKDADAALTRDLEARGLLFAKQRAAHSYPHCWRCKTPLYYYPTPAWFIRTTAYKDRMVAANREVRWVPPQIGAGRFGDWLENNVDWNISRDRYWGTPLPYWVCDGCDLERAVGGIAELAELAGGLPDDFDPHKPGVDAVTFACGACGGTLRRTSPVADVWFDSGSVPFAQYHWPHAPDSAARLADQYPADFIAEGLDQTRGWFYTLHAIGTFVASLAPEELPTGVALPAGPVFRTCAVNGLVLDKDGVKMSKSLGNVVDPWQQIERHGIDALRWYMLSSGSPWLPKRYDDAGVLEVRRRFFGTLANSYKFLAEYARIDGFDPQARGVPAVAERPAIDRWLVSRTQTTIARTLALFDDYDLPAACDVLASFVVDEVSNWYIRRNRRRFWKGPTGADKLAAFATLHAALHSATLLMAPVAPFLAELLWERLGGVGSVHAALLPEPHGEQRDEGLEQSMRIVERVVEMGRALRERAGLRVRQPLRALHVRCSDPADLALLASAFASAQIHDELNVKGWGSLGTDDGKLVHLRAKANFRVLGKRVAAQMKSAAAAIEALPAEAIAALRAGRELDLPLEPPVRIGPEDVLISVETDADFDIETDGRFVAWLDVELDEALRAEGLAREVVNRVNGLRKERGLAVEERVRLAFRTPSAALERAVLAHAEMIAGEVLALEIERAAAEPAEPAGPEWASYELGEGMQLDVRLRRA